MSAPAEKTSIAAELFTKMPGATTCAVVKGRGALGPDGLRDGLTAWWGKTNEDMLMAHILLPVGVRAEDVKESVQKEIDALIAGTNTKKKKEE